MLSVIVPYREVMVVLCRQCTDMTRCGTNAVSYSTIQKVMVVLCRQCTDMTRCGTNAVSCSTIQKVMVPMRSVTVHLARRGFQHCVVYCLLPPTLVYFTVLRPGLFKVHCLVHCTTTRTPFKELPRALC